MSHQANEVGICGRDADRLPNHQKRELKNYVEKKETKKTKTKKEFRRLLQLQTTAIQMQQQQLFHGTATSYSNDICCVHFVNENETYDLK